MFTWLHLFTGYSLTSHVDLSVLSTLITECFLLLLFFFDRFSVSVLLVSSFFVFFFPTTASAPTIDTFHRFFPSFFLYLLHHEVFLFFLPCLSSIHEHTHTTLSLIPFFFLLHTHNLSLSSSVIHLSIYRLLSSTNEFSRFPITAMNASLMQLAVCHHGLILSAMRSVICPPFVKRFVLHN